MTIPTINVLSTQFIKVLVRGTRAGVPINLSTDRVQFQVVPTGHTIADSGWTDGIWEVANSRYVAILLIGPQGGMTLPIGVYDVWVKVIDNPEVPILQSGSIEIIAAT